MTPFTADLNINWTSLERNVAFQVDQGIDGVLSMGTTGESATVAHEEHSKITANVISYVNGGCGLLAGTGSNSTDEALFETSRAVDNGAKACLLVDCYYNKPSSLELRREYYSVLCDAYPDTEFIAYAIPGRSVTAISPEDIVIANSEHENLIAVKEATGDFERMTLTRKLAGSDFGIISGDDPNTFKMMTDPAIKAAGVISVISNVVPGAISKLTSLIIDGKMEDAQKLNDALAPLSTIVGVSSQEDVTMPDGSIRNVTYKFPNPLPIKALMSGLGMMDGRCKRPLGKMTATAVAQVRAAAMEVRGSDPDILEPVGEFYGVDVDVRLADDGVWDALSY